MQSYRFSSADFRSKWYKLMPYDSTGKKLQVDAATRQLEAAIGDRKVSSSGKLIVNQCIYTTTVNCRR
jgi:hypothetical protein